MPDIAVNDRLDKKAKSAYTTLTISERAAKAF
jgi:hypothetical protein